MAFRVVIEIMCVIELLPVLRCLYLVCFFINMSVYTVLLTIEVLKHTKP